CSAYRQNLTLRQAGFQVLEARAQQAIAVGNLFPQTQQAKGDYTRSAVSTEVANRSNVSKRFYSQWDYGFNLAWEVDFWGRFRQANNQLCFLLGIPPEELQAKLGPAPIPTAPADVAAGIPADLLRRRPDVRRAERLAAAQSAEIGVAEAEFYPHISITGTIGYSSERFKNLFRSPALAGTFGPSFQWNILNYGRILSN